MEQKMIEEAARRYAETTPDNDPIRIMSFIEGAKWMAEQMYSEQDMRICWGAAYIDALTLNKEPYNPLFFEDVIELLKNK